MKSFTGVQSHFVITEISFLSLDHSSVQMGSSPGMCCSEMCVSQAARHSPYLCLRDTCPSGEVSSSTARGK